MALFKKNGTKLELKQPTQFSNEKALQALIDKNLGIVFNCRFVASEFSTGAEHAGRIDTLALSEDNEPVIIEYKKVESSDLINQSLFYLSWLQDHHGDFEMEAQKTLGKNVSVDWPDIRVICIAPGFKKYDLHAVKMMGANLELWQYRLFDNDTLLLEEVFRKAAGYYPGESATSPGKNPVMVAAGKKAALTRATGQYTWAEHLKKAGKETRTLLLDMREFILGISDSVEESPKKLYVAYKVAQNFVCIDVRKDKFYLFLKLDPSKISDPPKNYRNMRKVGHYGTGDFQLTIKVPSDVEDSKQWIRRAFERVGGE